MHEAPTTEISKDVRDIDPSKASATTETTEVASTEKSNIEQAPIKTFDDGKDLNAITGKEATAGLDAFAKELGGELPGLSTKHEEEARKKLVETKPKEEVKKEEPKKDEETKVTPTVDAKDGTKQAEEVEATKAPTEEELKQRDFTGLEENEIPLLKRMSNAAYNYVKPALVELKAKRAEAKRLSEENAQLKIGKVTLPDNYNEHPEAFVLTPEFKDISRNIQLASNFEQHWQQQAINIENGKDWHPIVSDGKGGYMSGAPQPANVEAKYMVLQNLNHVASQKGREQGKLEALQTSFKSRHQEAIGQLTAKEKELFGYMDDEKHVTNKTFKEIKAMFHPAFQQNPVTNIAAKALTGLLQYKAAYEQLIAKQGTKETITKQVADDSKKAGPNNKTIDSGGNTKAKPTVSMDMFKAAMED